MRKEKLFVTLTLAVIFFSTTLLLEHKVKGIGNRYGIYSRNTFFAEIMAGIKKFVGHECWMQTDVYLHQGLVHEHDHEHDNKHEDEIDGGLYLTVIDESSSFAHHDHSHITVEKNIFKPYNREDFANTKHKTSLNNRDLLPWFRLATFMDPQMTRAYSNGGHWLAWATNRKNEALVFLEEGLANNPGAPDILMEIGLIYYDPKNRFGDGNINKAIRAFSEALKNEQSPAGQIALLTYRSKCLEIAGRVDEAIADVNMKIQLLKSNANPHYRRIELSYGYLSELESQLIED